MKRQLVIGDTIKAQGITATIAEITFQEPWAWRKSWYIEFTDTDGNYRNWKQSDDGGTAYDKDGNEITDENTTNNTNSKEDKNMNNKTNGQAQVMQIEVNGVKYTTTRPNYYYKNENGKQVRISKAEYDAAWEQSAELEKAEREAKQEQSDKIAEGAVNGKKDQPKKPVKKSKDIAYDGNGVTLTAKQVNFIQLMPQDDFYEHGLDSTLWIDVFCDTIADQFSPMAVGAMVSTLREKNLISVSKERVNGKTSKYMAFTELGQMVAKDLGLE